MTDTQWRENFIDDKFLLFVEKEEEETEEGAK